MLSVFFLTVSAASGVWAYRAALSECLWAECPLGLAALCALFTSLFYGRETSRLLQLAGWEEMREWRQALSRPRL